MRAFFLGFLFFGFLSKSLSFLGFVITGASGRGTVGAGQWYRAKSALMPVTVNLIANDV